MRFLIAIPAAFAAASCSHPAQAPGAAFARELAGHVAGSPQSCVTSYPSENLRVIDPSTIAYGYGRTIYVNHLAAACPALDSMNTIIVHGLMAGQYCRGDRVQAREPGAIIPGPQCILRDWVPYRAP